MKIRFRTRKLQSQYEHSAEAVKEYGTQVARKYIERVNIIQKAADLEVLKRLPCLNVHPLKMNRKRQWAITLTGYIRLIFTLEGENLEIICIEKVSKHYDE